MRNMEKIWLGFCLSFYAVWLYIIARTLLHIKNFYGDSVLWIFYIALVQCAGLLSSIFILTQIKEVPMDAKWDILIFFWLSGGSLAIITYCKDKKQEHEKNGS